MRIRLKNGRFGTVKKAREERNKWFHPALIAATRDLKRAGFEGVIKDVSINARVINLETVWFWQEIVKACKRVEATKLFPDIIYNISVKDTNGRWFAVTHAWENIELAANEFRKRIKEAMERYMRQEEDDDEYGIVSIEVSVYPWRK